MTSTKNTRTGTRRHGRSKTLLALIGAALMAGAPVAAAYAQDAAPAPKPPVAAPMASAAAGPAGDKDQARMGDRDMRRHGGWHKGRHMGGQMGGRGRMMMMERMMTPAKVAGALSVLETGMGITPEQTAVWRRFSGALVAFTEASQPPRMGPRMRPGMDDGDGPGSDRAAATQDDQDTVAPGDDDQAGNIGDDTADAADADADDAAGATADAGTPDQAQRQPGARAFRLLDRVADQAIARGAAAETLKSAMAELQTTLTPEQIRTGRGLVRSMIRDARQAFRQEHMERRGEGRQGWHHGPGRHGHHGDFARGDRGHHGPHRGMGHGMGQDGPRRGGPDGGPGDGPDADNG